MFTRTPKEFPRVRYQRGDVVDVEHGRMGIVLRNTDHTDPITYEVLVGTQKVWMVIEEGKMVSTFYAWYKNVTV